MFSLPTDFTKLTNHRLEPNDTHHVVIKSDDALLGGIAVDENIEDVVVETIACRVESLTKLKSV